MALRAIEIRGQRGAVEDLRRERADLFVAGRCPPLEAKADDDIWFTVRPRARVDHLDHEGQTLIRRERPIAGGDNFGPADGIRVGGLLIGAIGTSRSDTSSATMTLLSAKAGR